MSFLKIGYFREIKLTQHGVGLRIGAILCLAVLCTCAAAWGQGFSHDYTDEEKQFIAARPEILVSNEFDWPPFDFVIDGKPAGFGIDLMKLLARKTGLNFTYVNGYTWDELTQMFFDGKLDIIHSLSITPERQKKAFFSSPTTTPNMF